MSLGTSSWHSRVASRLILLVAALLGRHFIDPSNAFSQSDTMSASLARVLAETADGLRDGQAHWIVADPRYPHQMLGVFSTLSEARAGLSRAPTMGVYGPFVTPIDFGRPWELWLDGCVHLMKPLPSLIKRWCPERIFPLNTIQEVTLEIRTNRETVRVDLNGADAVFFTASSFQKFVLPYYSRVYGADYAKSLLDTVVARVRRMP